MQNPFDQFDAPSRPAARQAPSVIYGTPKEPDAIDLRRDARAEAADRRAEAAADRQVQSANRTATIDQQKLTSSLRDDYQRDPAVKSYLQAVPGYAAALESSNNPQGDLNLIYAFAKVMDPESVVREGEAASVAQSDTIYGRTVARLQKELGDGGTFSAEARKNLRDELRIRMGQLNDAYIGARVRYKKLAETGGYDPESVVGEHAGKRFQDSESRFLGRPVMEADYEGNVIPRAPAEAPIAKERNDLTISNLTDFATGLSGGKYEITETGLSYDGEPVNASPDILNSDEYAAAYRAKFGKEPPLSINVTDESPAALDKTRDTAFGAVDAAVRGAADTITLGAADEIAAAGDTIFGGGTMRDNLRRQRAIDRSDERVNSGSRFVGQVGGALLPWGRMAGAGVQAQRSALRMGGEGAALGGVYGFNSGEGSFADRAANVPGAALAGGALGYGFGALGNRLARPPRDGGTPPRGASEAVEVAKAATEEGIPVSRPIIDPSRRDAMAYLESSIGGGPVRQALQGTSDAIESRAGALGRGGVVQEGGVIGQRIQDAGERYIEKSRGVGGRLYDRADQMSGGATVSGKDAVRVLDEQIADLQGNASTNSPLIKYLQEIRADFVDDAGNLKAKSIGDIRDLRTQLRGNINNRNLTATDAERRVGIVLDAAKADIQRDLGKSAPAAVRQYDRADKFWRERKSEIDQVVRRVIGNKSDKLSGEQVWSRIKTMSSEGGDSARLGRLWGKLEPEEQADAAATIAAKLGRRSAEEEFSPALFVSSVRSLSPAARREIFGPEGAKSINNLRMVAEAYRDTAARLNNSRSGQVQQWGNFLSGFVPFTGGGALVGGLPGAVVGGAIAIGGAGLRNLSARALMSPNMSKWLKEAPRQTTPEKVARHIERLRVVATRDPAIAQDALGLQRYLQQAITTTPQRAAADSGRSPADQEKQ